MLVAEDRGRKRELAGMRPPHYHSERRGCSHGLPEGTALPLKATPGSTIGQIYSCSIEQRTWEPYRPCAAKERGKPQSQAGPGLGWPQPGGLAVVGRGACFRRQSPVELATEAESGTSGQAFAT